VTALLQISGLHKRFGSQAVLRGLDLAVEAGETVGLLGPNGCGKSTTLNTVCGLLQPDAGQVLMAGRPVSRGSVALAGYCPQDSALYRDLLPAENLDFFARLYGLSAARRRSRVDELMQLFGLLPHAATRAGRLSSGWRQRLSLAVALVHTPPLLILDEPGSAVDVAARQDLWALIERLRAGGTTILLTTHQLAEAERLCQRVALMRDGRIAAVGSVAELRQRVPALAVAQLQTADESATLQRAAVLRWPVRRYGGQLCCLLPQAATLREVVEALDGAGVTAVSVQPVTLEHAYLETLQPAAVAGGPTGSAPWPAC
jgi:ABC-2 type transport system ATP-binding protein